MNPGNDASFPGKVNRIYSGLCICEGNEFQAEEIALRETGLPWSTELSNSEVTGELGRIALIW